MTMHWGSASFTVAHQHRACLQAAFLLPWRRIFNLSDSQLYVAKRENAKALFRGHIESKGGILQVLSAPSLSACASALTTRNADLPPGSCV